MKRAIILLILSMIIPLVSAVPPADLEVEIMPIDDVIIAGVPGEARFDMRVKNNDVSDTFQIYSLIEPDFQPKEFFTIESGRIKSLDIVVKPSPRTLDTVRGQYYFAYEIKGNEAGFFTNRMLINIVELEEAFEIEVESITPDSKEATITIKNKVGYEFENVEFRINSPFFDEVVTESFGKEGTTAIRVPVEIGEALILVAGDYDVNTGVKYAEQDAEVKSSMKYLEKDGISTSEATDGTVIRKNSVIKRNEGNIVTLATVEMKKNILTRLFTTFSETPHEVEKKGLFVDYKWERELSPGATLTITSVTNYTVPFLLAILVVVVVVIVWRLNSRVVSVNKRVSFVKTKGGEFALRVRLQLKARKHVEDLELVDRLPRIAKLYNHGRQPDHVDHQTRRLVWRVHSLDAGETRTFSYIMYSKISVIGRLTLPLAKLTFKRGETRGKVESNSTSFLSEQSRREED